MVLLLKKSTKPRSSLPLYKYMVYWVEASSPFITTYSLVKSVADNVTVATTDLLLLLTTLIEVTGAPFVTQRARTEFNVMSLTPGALNIDDKVFTAPRFDHIECLIVSRANAFTCTWYN